MQPHFFVHFFSIVLHHYNFQKLPSFTFFQRKYCIYSCSLFPTAAHFYFSGRQHFSFSHCNYNLFNVFRPTKLVSIVFISCCGYFSVIIQVKVGIKIQSKEKLGFVLVFSLEKSWWSCDLPPKCAGCLKCKISAPAYMQWQTY